MTMKKLFLHMPKCAGSSVLSMLEAAVPQLLDRDYQSYFRIPRPERNQVLLENLLHPRSVAGGRIVYGHFFPVKYIGQGTSLDFRLVTILRDPIARLQSHYKFWNAGDFSDHYLWRKMKLERWTFEDFAFSEEMRNFYAQHFSQVSLGAFAFIGLYENLDYSVDRCFEVLGISRPAISSVPKVNVTPPRTSIDLSPDAKEKLKAHHSDDYLIYEFARRRFHVQSQPVPPQP